MKLNFPPDLHSAPQKPKQSDYGNLTFVWNRNSHYSEWGVVVIKHTFWSLLNAMNVLSKKHGHIHTENLEAGFNGLTKSLKPHFSELKTSNVHIQVTDSFLEWPKYYGGMGNPQSRSELSSQLEDVDFKFPLNTLPEFTWELLNFLLYFHLIQHPG